MLQLPTTKAPSGVPRVTAQIKSVKPIFPRWMQETGYTLRTWERTRNQQLPPSMASEDLKLTTTSQNPIGMSSLISIQFTLHKYVSVGGGRPGLGLSGGRESGDEGERGRRDERSKWEKEMRGLETYMLCSSFCLWKHLWKLACVLSSLYML